MAISSKPPKAPNPSPKPDQRTLKPTPSPGGAGKESGASAKVQSQPVIKPK